jgi:hypothetical protein
VFANESYQAEDILGIVGLVTRLYQRLSPLIFESTHLEDVGDHVLVTDHDTFLISQSAMRRPVDNREKTYRKPGGAGRVAQERSLSCTIASMS